MSMSMPAETCSSLCIKPNANPLKTTMADDEAKVLPVGALVAALREWLERADIAKGPIFQAFDRLESGRGLRADAAVDQPHRESPMRGRRTGSAGLFGVWLEG